MKRTGIISLMILILLTGLNLNLFVHLCCGSFDRISLNGEQRQNNTCPVKVVQKTGSKDCCDVIKLRLNSDSRVPVKTSGEKLNLNVVVLPMPGYQTVSGGMSCYSVLDPAKQVGPPGGSLNICVRTEVIRI